MSQLDVVHQVEADYLWEEVVFLCNLIQHLMGFDGRTDVSLQHLRHIIKSKYNITEMAQKKKNWKSKSSNTRDPI